MEIFLKEKIRPLKSLFLQSTLPKCLLALVALVFAAFFQFWAEREAGLLSKGRLSFLTAESKESKTPVRPRDVNQLTFKELEALPGIGKTLAGEIIKDREARGPFQKRSDLLRVKGIGPARLKGIASYLYFKSGDEPETIE